MSGIATIPFRRFPPTELLPNSHAGGLPRDFGIDSRLQAKLPIGRIVHELMGGADYRQNRNSYFK